MNVMTELLDRGADPNTRDLMGRTPVMLVCVHGEYEMLRLLLKKGADPTLIDFGTRTALSYAKEYNRKSCIRVLTQEHGVKY